MEQANRISEACEHLRKPATTNWIAKRVTVTLLHYYAADLPEGAQAAIAGDWRDELAPYPAWALKAAFAWWISVDNKHRRKRPIPGDIAERVRVEMAEILASEIKLRSFKGTQRSNDRPAPEPEAERKKPSKLGTKNILEQAGYRVDENGQIISA